MMKYCCDCKHYKFHEFKYIKNDEVISEVKTYCIRNITYHPVDKSPYRGVALDCKDERAEVSPTYQRCGLDAIQWEPK